MQSSARTNRQRDPSRALTPGRSIVRLYRTLGSGRKTDPPWRNLSEAQVSVHVQAAVDIEHMPGDVAGLLGGE
ncbi:MAG TPA: hypothetical protein VGR96_04935, partial [Acidobacteriaceae bacterium]|nr:hypothetical protein [Acidobacteriaceae bacterium]